MSINRRTYTDDELITAVASSTSIRQVLTKLGLREAGGNYSGIRNRIASLSLDVEHLQGQAWRRGEKQPVVQARSLEEVLQKGVAVSSHKLKKRLFAQGFKSKACEQCGLSEWLGLPISLELDHINGDNSDNRIDNLRILCPNCHAQTDTYRGKKLTKCRDETAPS